MQSLPFSLLLIKLNPGSFPCFDFGLAAGLDALRAGDVVSALEESLNVLRRDPNDAIALVLSADAFNALGRSFEALELLQKARDARPFNRAISLLLSLQMLNLGRFEEAGLEIDAALVLPIDSAEYSTNLEMLESECLARAFLAQHFPAKAWDVLAQLRPLPPELSGLAAETLLELDRPGDAIPMAGAFFQHQQSAESANLLARCHFRNGDQASYAKTLHAASLALPLEGGLASLAIQACFDQADDLATVSSGQTMLKKALQDSPNSPELLFLQARQLLLDGHFREGWDAYHSRLALSSNQLHCACPGFWSGESPCGRSVVVVAEQGVGDILFYARFLPGLIAEARAVWLLVEPRLGPILRRSFPRVVVLCEVELAHAMAGSEALWIPLGSLPMRYGYSLDMISGSASSTYLKMKISLQKWWNARLSTHSPGRLRIGLSLTSGGPSQEYQQRKRDVDPLIALRPLRNRDVVIIDLQHRSNLPAFDAFPGSVPRLCRFDHVTHDLDHLCALISQIDLLVTSDQTNAFLGGMLGVPTVAIVPPNPHFMFMRQGPASPWYQSLRIVRAGAWSRWDSVVDSYCIVIEDLLSQLSSRFSCSGM
jgi:tetratricopeptide (TPR) repeat protein